MSGRAAKNFIYLQNTNRTEREDVYFPSGCEWRYSYFWVLISIKVVSVHSGLTTACDCGVIKLNSPHPARMTNGQRLLHGCHINHFDVDVSHFLKRSVDSEGTNRVPFNELEQVPATNLVPRRRSDCTGLSAITREERGCSMLPRVSHNTTEAPGI